MSWVRSRSPAPLSPRELESFRVFPLPAMVVRSIIGRAPRARPLPAAASVRRRETRPRSRRDASRRRERDRASYLFFRNGAHPGPEHLQLLEPAGPDELSVPHGHVRTPVAHVLVAIREEIHGLDDRHGLVV